MKTTDLTLATLLINGSGQDSGETDYRICHLGMESACRSPARKAEILATVDALRRAIEKEY